MFRHKITTRNTLSVSQHSGLLIGDHMKKLLGGHCLSFRYIWRESSGSSFELCTVIRAEIRFNWDKLNNNLWPGNSSRNRSLMLHIWGAELFQPMGLWLREPQATINLNFSLLLSHLFSFFLPSAPIYPPRSVLLQSIQKYTFQLLITDIFQLAKQLTSAVSKPHRLSFETKAPFPVNYRESAL